MRNQKKKGSPIQQSLFQTDAFSRIYLIMMLCIFPLFLTTGKYLTLTSTKATFFFVVTGLYILSIPMLRLTRFDGVGKQSPYKPNFSVAEWALLAFLFFCIISALFSPYPKYTFWGIKERNDGLMTALMYGGAFFLISRYYRPRRLDFLLFAGSAMLVSVIAILQYFNMDVFHLFPYERLPEFTPQTIIFRTTLGNIDFVSAYTSLTMLFFGILYIKSEGKHRFIYLGAGMLCTMLMVLAGAEAGMVGALAAFVLSVPFVLTDGRSIARTAFVGFSYSLSIFSFKLAAKASEGASIRDMLGSRWLLLSLILLVISAAVYFIYPHIRLRITRHTVRIIATALMVFIILSGFAFVEIVGRNPDMGTVYQAREMMHGTMKDEFGTYRGYVWNCSIDLLKEKTPPGQLLFGSGPDTFVNRFRPFRSESIDLLGKNYDKAHNEYLQILFCQGIFGLIAYLVFLFAVCRKAVARAFDDPLVLAAGLGAVCIYDAGLFQHQRSHRYPAVLSIACTDCIAHACGGLIGGLI